MTHTYSFPSSDLRAFGEVASDLALALDHLVSAMLSPDPTVVQDNLVDFAEAFGAVCAETTSVLVARATKTAPPAPPPPSHPLLDTHLPPYLAAYADLQRLLVIATEPLGTRLAHVAALLARLYRLQESLATYLLNHKTTLSAPDRERFSETLALLDSHRASLLAILDRKTILLLLPATPGGE